MTSEALILGIESSCDETACAVVSSNKRILSSVVSRNMMNIANLAELFPKLRHGPIWINVIYWYVKRYTKQISNSKTFPPLP